MRSLHCTVLLALLVVVGACTPRPAERQPEQAQQTATAPVAGEVEPAELARVQGISVGRDDAPVVIYEFADFQCPACAQFASFGTPYIKEQYVEAGTVRYVHYDFPLVSIHPHAFLGARAARCANEQGRFWEYHDTLYEEQRAWADADDALPLFVRYAEGAGLEREPFETCLRSDRYAVEVTRNMQLGQSLGVPGTPTIFVNGKRANIRSLEDLDRIIREEAGMGAGTGM
ncbi:MAG: DsbA family protein [Gemmatimonadetes bacterium]|nr:DsbA family protein [Gemmatimonadota bacterium]